MDSLENRTAVVTGAASGIGLALARRLAAAGMNVVLTDIDRDELDRAGEGFRQFPGTCRLELLDVADRGAWGRLAEMVWSELGGAHVLCNNAGVDGYRGGTLWEASDEDWDWTFGVNLWGVVNGTRTFLPRMLESGEPGHIVNTASAAALTKPNNMYGITKHSVLAFTEAVDTQLRARDADVGITALIPDVVATPFFAKGHRTDGGAAAARDRERGADIRAANDALLRKEGASPDLVAERAVRAILGSELYALTHESSKSYLRRRTEDILSVQTEVK